MFDPRICVCPRTMKYRYRPGTTPILTDKVVPLKLEVVKETVQQMEMAWATTHNNTSLLLFKIDVLKHFINIIASVYHDVK